MVLVLYVPLGPSRLSTTQFNVYSAKWESIPLSPVRSQQIHVSPALQGHLEHNAGRLRAYRATMTAGSSEMLCKTSNQKTQFTLRIATGCAIQGFTVNLISQSSTELSTTPGGVLGDLIVMTLT